MFEKTEDNINRRCKIICTMGPSSWDLDKLPLMFEAGMNIARLNFSHGGHEEKAELVGLIRQVEDKYNHPISILADLQGPKLRVGQLLGG